MTKSRVVRVGVVTAALAAAAAFAGVGVPGAAHSETAPAAKSITVSGNGSVRVVPNVAVFGFGVVSDATTAAAALAANGTEMRKVIDALKKAGIADKDLQTQYVSVSPRYSNDGTTLVGYTASNSVTAMLRSIAGTGAIIDAAVAAGANSVNGPSLTVDDTDALYQKALTAAVANARAKAQTLASAGGLTLGAVHSVVEDGATPRPVPMAEAKSAVGGDTPIEAGSQEIQASVTVQFDAS